MSTTTTAARTIGTTTSTEDTSMSNEQNNGPIVVGVDESETARAAARRAAELAEALGAELHIVMATGKPDSHVVKVGSDEFQVDDYASAEAHLQTVRLSLGYDKASTELGNAPAGKMLADIAARIGAQTIVVGNRRVQGVSRVLGSVASDVLRHAPCDVLVVNTTDV